MDQLFPDHDLQSWLSASPALGDDPKIDADAMFRHLQVGETLLAGLPAKSVRSPDQKQIADRIHDVSRQLRRLFLNFHADWLYGLLTKDRTQPLSLSELAFAAAEHCPGLVPARMRIAKERALLQAEKEGCEIDQGLFFQALLRLPDVGAHIIETALRPTPRGLDLLARFRSEGRLDLGSVLIERRDCAAHLTINNASCLNAEDNGLVDDIETAVDLALLDPDVRVGVLRGGVMTHPRYAGRRLFSAGINLKALHKGQISYVDFLLRRELGFISKLMRGVRPVGDGGEARNTEKPWIAAVDGFAIGGGAQLLLVFDHVIAAADSYISLPAANEGIVPGFANLRLTRAVGSRIARQMILGGRKIWASEPDARLLVDQVVDPTRLDAAIDAQMPVLSAPAAIANRHMLHLTEEPTDLFVRYAAEFSLLQAERLYSSDLLDKVRPA
jgi:(3,5-dihydroxyphenyl)acetyl-CoA 1,2-dioxygenase